VGIAGGRGKKGYLGMKRIEKCYTHTYIYKYTLIYTHTHIYIYEGSIRNPIKQHLKRECEEMGT
jgi:hypothetical protein